MGSKKLSDRTRRLVDVAMGRTPADLVIRNGRWVSVQSGEILDGFDIAVSGEHIAYVGVDATHTIGEKTQVIEADSKYLVPGLLDGHMHVESGMVTVTEFARAVIPHGTTGMFIDPHEIANVFGLRGVRMMVDEALDQPIHVWVQVPSCVPSAPGLETPGADIGPKEVAEALKWPGVIGLGEMMNFPGVFNSDEKMHAEMAVTREAGVVIGGHYASPDLGLPFHGYAAGGPEDDHEGTRLEDVVARVRQGMKAMLRLGSGVDDIKDQLPAILEMGLDPRHIIMVTDDSHAETLVNEGHINRAVKHSISLGVDPIVAVQMATLNTAEHFGVARDVGQIAPGRFADILLISDLKEFAIDMVIAKGSILAEEGQLIVEIPKYKFPKEARHSVKIGRDLSAEDFIVSYPDEGRVDVNVIGIVEQQVPTQHLIFPMDASNGRIPIDRERDLAKIAVVERHKGTGGVQVGFVNGFGFSSECAIASTVAHDSHHMVVVGTDEGNMAIAANELGRIGGGQVVVLDGKIIGLVELPIAGLMSDERAEIVAQKTETVLEGIRATGCKLRNANMHLSFLALVVIPELRISDIGLVDVMKFEVVPVVKESQ